MNCVEHPCALYHEQLCHQHVRLEGWKLYVLFQELLPLFVTIKHCTCASACTNCTTKRKSKPYRLIESFQMKALKGWPNKWHCTHDHGHGEILHHWHKSNKPPTIGNVFCFGPSPAGCKEVLLVAPPCSIFLYRLCKFTTFVVGPFGFISFAISRQSSKNWGQVVSMQHDQKICRLGPLGRAQNANLRVPNLDAYHLLTLDFLLRRVLIIRWSNFVIPFLLEFSQLGPIGNGSFSAGAVTKQSG